MLGDFPTSYDTDAYEMDQPVWDWRADRVIVTDENGFGDEVRFDPAK